jgi:hypothetical protein
MSRDVEKSLLEIDFASLTRGPFTPSPAAWEDQVLYFLMLDRFSDGNEKGGHPFPQTRIPNRHASRHGIDTNTESGGFLGLAATTALHIPVPTWSSPLANPG